MLVLGGGGYKISNVARCWAYETGTILGETCLTIRALMLIPHALQCSRAEIAGPCDPISCRPPVTLWKCMSVAHAVARLLCCGADTCCCLCTVEGIDTCWNRHSKVMVIRDQ